MEVSMNTKGFRRYGKQVREAEVAGNVLRLPNGFLGKQLLPLWLHPNYILLEDFLVRNTKGDAMDVDEEFKVRKSQFHLVGTPGIGKSYFGHYWFFKQAKDGKRVIWRSQGGVFVYFDFSLEDPFVHASSDYVVPGPWLEDIETIWLVVDGGCKGLDHDGFVLQCVSPGRSGYHEFAKDVGVPFHLEAWTLEELMRCRDALNLGFTDEELAERFYYCGGLPREVLDKRKTSQSLKDFMTTAVSWAPSWEAVIRDVASGADAISNYLLHYRLQRELGVNAVASDCVLQFTLKFASFFVEDLVVDKFQRLGHGKVREFFDFCQRVPEARALSRKFFEKNVHRKLQDGGGDYTIKDLVTPDKPHPVFELKPSSTKRLRRWEVTKVAEGKPSKDEKMRGSAVIGKGESVGLANLDRGCFVNSYAAVFKSLDSFVVPDIMIQCTCSLDHKIFWAPVLEVVQEYDRWYSLQGSTPPPYYRLIFIVPECRFRDFKFQGATSCFKYFGQSSHLTGIKRNDFFSLLLDTVTRLMAWFVTKSSRIAVPKARLESSVYST
ncbi:hypothetical protein SELMODRAFT_410703 [Selaginella moellendorffii]|uniref:Crinkler (CRN) family protein n=1 Tax=Selaginella moellendorffii TaxID=88036 RepID=D8RFK7_SELML|nr:hypothetical protein SELMODRAFT_410703 [Selaginella moellendorffii]